MGSESRSRLRFFRTSLRVSIALGVALPILLLLTGLSLAHYWHERQLLEEQLRWTTLQLGETLTGSLHYAMLHNDFELVARTLADVGRMKSIQQVQIVDLDGQIKVDSRSLDVGLVRQPDDLGCRECHQYPAKSRPRVARLSTSTGVLRISTPIDNAPECNGCHNQEDTHLGVLLADVSIVNIEERLFTVLRTDLAISAGITILVTLCMYLLIHWLVVRRVEAFRQPLARFAAGDLSARVPVSPGPNDELAELAIIFNRMADERERHAREQEEIGKLRQLAIVEERARIARELHDGLAQLLGYVNTKAMAVRLMLKNRQMEAADQNLLQLEEAARELFVDVRAAILNLKVAGEGGANLVATLKNFVAQFSRLSGLPVELALAPAVESVPLPAETTQQLLRTVQESLTNVRKHAAASRAWINLHVDEGVLELTIRDDGQGFDPNHCGIDHLRHIGLGGMRERAEAIRAEFVLDTEPGVGTQVTVRLPLEEQPQVLPRGLS